MIREHRRPGDTLVAVDASEPAVRSGGDHEMKERNLAWLAAILVVGPVVGIGGAS